MSVTKCQPEQATRVVLLEALCDVIACRFKAVSSQAKYIGADLHGAAQAKTSSYGLRRCQMPGNDTSSSALRNKLIAVSGVEARLSGSSWYLPRGRGSSHIHSNDSTDVCSPLSEAYAEAKKESASESARIRQHPQRRSASN